MEQEEVDALEIIDGLEETPAGNDGWDRICDSLRAMVGNDAFLRWFRAAKWLGVEDDVASVAVPGEIHQVWIETNYLPEVITAVTGVFDEVLEVRIVVGEELQRAAGQVQVTALAGRDIAP